MTRWAFAASCAGLLCGALAFPALADKDTIRIGVLTDANGPVSDLSGNGSITAAQLAVEDASGAVLGRPVAIVVGDHQNKPDVGSTIARKWFDEDGVDAIVDVPTSSVGLAIQEIVKQKRKVFLNTGGTSSEFTGEKCTPFATQWSTDTYIVSAGVTGRLVKQGLDSWFFLVTDYTFGQALEADATRAITKAGGRVVGSVRHPLNTQDFSSFLLKAQGSGAKVIGLANASGDTIRSIQQAREFGLADGPQTIVAFILHLTDVHALGLQAAQGSLFLDGFYWDRDDGTRAWTQRFMARNRGRAPTSIQASVYSAVTHYLKAVAAEGSIDAEAVSAKMKALRIADALIPKGSIRADGKIIKDYYVLQVKTPAESMKPWDYLKIVDVVPGQDVARPLAEGGCPSASAKP